MSDTQFIFAVIKFIELFVFIVYGYILSKTKSTKDFWIKALVPIITYTLIEGLRFGRYIDWNLYYFRYNNLGRNINSEDYEIIFRYICHYLYQLGIPYYIFITLQCAFLITSTFVLLKRYRNKLYFMIPAILTMLSPNEMFIRWYLGFSFMLLSINCILNNKVIHSYIYLLCACLTHIGFVLFVPIFILYRYLDKYAIPPKLGSIIFVVSSIILTISSLSILTNVANIMLTLGLGSVDEKLSSYLMDTQDLVSGEWGQTGIMEQSLATRIRKVIAFLPAIYCGKQILEKYNYGYFIYNLFVIGAIVSPLFLLVEILNRFSSALSFFSVICCGLIYYEFIMVKKNKMVMKIICIISFILLIWPSIMEFIQLRHNEYTLFIWDANGRNYINW
mgnify:CR=1 FL=1